MLKWILSVIVTLVMFAVSLKWFSEPFIWAFGSLFLFCLVFAVWSRRSAVRAAAVNVGVIFLGLALFELYLFLTASTPFHLDRQSDRPYSVTHPALGYRPSPNNRVISRRTHGGEPVYDAVYTFDSRALRISPPVASHGGDGSILFFGGSYTFGYGVNDDETLPYQAGLKTKGRYCVFNFGFEGYGPHQMLAALEFGLVDSVVQGPALHVIYQAIYGHVKRVTGRAEWDRNGPRYEIQSGEAVFAGRFDQAETGKWRALWERHLAKCRIGQRIRQRRIPFNSRDIDLFAAIVDRSRGICRQKYPESTFTVLFWDEAGVDVCQEIVERLRERDLNVVLLSRVLPELEKNDGLPLRLGPRDRHPNPETHARLAEFLIRHFDL
jgi:hypothetical protein